MKNLNDIDLKNGLKLCKTSEVFCKPANLVFDNDNKISDLLMMRSDGHHDVQMTCKTSISQLNQNLNRFHDDHCRPHTPMGYIGVVPAHAVLLLCKALLVDRPELGVEVSCE